MDKSAQSSPEEEGNTSSRQTNDVKKGCCDDMIVNISLLSNGMNIGLNVGILGPSLPDLALQTGSTIPEMSVIFITSSIAYMLGSVSCGFMLGRFDGHLVISLTLILQALTTGIAPWCTNLAVMSAFVSFSYFFSTVVIAGTAFLCFRLERTRARVMTQSVFLLFNLGKAIVPFILAPFLNQAASNTPEGNLPWRKNMSNIDSWFHHFRRKEMDSYLNLSLTAASNHQIKSSVGYGYAIVGAFSLIMSVLYGIIFIKNGCHLWATSEQKTNELDATASTMASTSRWRKFIIVSLFFIMIFIQCGMESVDAGLLMSFLTQYLGRGTDMGVVANALYQGTKVVACILVVLTVRYIFPSLLLLIDLIFMLISTSLMAAAIAFNANDALLWISFTLLAIGMSNSYATLATWLETRYPITGKMTGILTISFGLGSMVLPTMTTFLLDTRGPIMFPIVLFGSSVACFIIYIVTKIVIGEKCCPKPDIGTAHVTRKVVALEESESEPLLPSPKARTEDSHPKESSFRRTKQQSLSDLSPDQCFHAYHSKFINNPTAPSASASRQQQVQPFGRI